MSERVRLNKASINALDTGGGPVARYRIKKGTEMLALAKSRCPVSKTEGEAHKHLRDALEMRINPRSVTVGVLHDEKLKDRMRWVQEGTKPHHIPTNPKEGKFLHFFIAGAEFFIHQEIGVDHPGTVADPFLLLSALDVGLIVDRVAASEF